MMNKILLSSFILVSSCIQADLAISQEAVASVDSVKVMPAMVTYFNDDVTYKDELYTTQFRVDKQVDDSYIMTIQMNLKAGSYYVSPNTKRATSGQFKIILDKNNTIKPTSALIESPLSVEENGGLTHFVREDTSYTQSFKVLTTNNFEVLGFIQFTIEPRCTLEKIPFIIRYQDGKLSMVVDGC